MKAILALASLVLEQCAVHLFELLGTRRPDEIVQIVRICIQIIEFAKPLWVIKLTVHCVFSAPKCSHARVRVILSVTRTYVMIVPGQVPDGAAALALQRHFVVRRRAAL